MTRQQEVGKPQARSLQKVKEHLLGMWAADVCEKGRPLPASPGPESRVRLTIPNTCTVLGTFIWAILFLYVTFYLVVQLSATLQGRPFGPLYLWQPWAQTSSAAEQALTDGQHTAVHRRLLYFVEASGNFVKQILIISILLGKKRQLPSFDGVTDTVAASKRPGCVGTEMRSKVPSVSLDRLPEGGASSLPPTPSLPSACNLWADEGWDQTSQVPRGGWGWCPWVWLCMEREFWACKIKLQLRGLCCHAVLQSCLLCCLVAQSCPILCNLMDCSPPGSSVHWISQARILEWVAISSSRGSSHAGTKPMCLPHLLHCRQTLYHWATIEALILSIVVLVQSPRCVWLFSTPHQASLSLTKSWSLPKLMFIASCLS